MNHYLTYPTNNTYACGAIATGRRNTARDTDPAQTTCPTCLEVVAARAAAHERADALGIPTADELGTPAIQFAGWQWPDVPARPATAAGA